MRHFFYFTCCMLTIMNVTEQHCKVRVCSSAFHSHSGERSQAIRLKCKNTERLAYSKRTVLLQFTDTRQIITSACYIYDVTQNSEIPIKNKNLGAVILFISLISTQIFKISAFAPSHTIFFIFFLQLCSPLFSTSQLKKKFPTKKGPNGKFQRPLNCYTWAMLPLALTCPIDKAFSQRPHTP